MNKYSLGNLFIALFFTILLVFANGICGGNGSMNSVLFCAIVSSITMACFEVIMKITGKMPVGNWTVYLTEAAICIGVSFLALAVVL